MLSLACIGVAGSFTTFRRRRLASPISIPEIEATHPLVNGPLILQPLGTGHSRGSVNAISPEREDRVHRTESERSSTGTVTAMPPVPRVVVIGGGFGGLQCGRALRGKPVDVTLVDQRNYH